MVMIFVSLCIIAGIEILAQRSTARGGLFLSQSLDDLPTYATFSYLYAPNIIAATYSLLWNWIDLDVKRMQPWFELSKSEGATGGSSLLLEYPSDFLPFVPLKALKRRHWHTFVSGSAILIIFWAITPLSGAILGTGTVSYVEEVTIVNRSSLLPLGEQALYLDTHILNEGYAIGWLGQSPPPFTTNDYSLLPFYTTSSYLAGERPQNITATTWKLTVDLNCERAANISKNGSTLTFDNGAGCQSPIAILGAGNYVMYYIGYENDPQSDWFLEGKGCKGTSENERLSLAIWALPELNFEDKRDVDFPVTALYCRTRYYKQRVIATVDSQTFMPYDDLVQPIADSEPLPDTEFNGGLFEHVIINGMENRETSVDKDIALNHVIDQTSKLEPLHLSEPGTVLTAYAVAGQNRSINAYADPKVLEDSFRRAHQYLFSVAVNGLMKNSTSFDNSTATSTYELFGVKVSRKISIAVECLIGAVVLLLFAVLWLCWVSSSHLISNPNAISRFTEICRDSLDIRELFADFDIANTKAIQARFREERFRLAMRQTPYGNRPTIERIPGERPVHVAENKNELRDYHFETIRPFWLKTPFGIAFVLALLGAIATVVVLKLQELRLNGRFTSSLHMRKLKIDDFLCTELIEKLTRSQGFLDHQTILRSCNFLKIIFPPSSRHL